MRNWWDRERLERVYEDKTDVESIESEMMETEATVEDTPPPVEDTVAFHDTEMPLPEEADLIVEGVSDESDLGEEPVSQEDSGDQSDAVEALEQEEVKAASEEQTDFEESVIESVEEIVGEDVDSEKYEEQTEDISDTPEEVVQEEVEAGAEEESPAVETGEEDRQYREEELKRMVKADLLSVCSDLGIDADENLLKSDLIALVLDGKE
jgi:hypothetical protein